jgi:hypothetical protein
MSWSISTRGPKQVGSFAAAEKVWTDAKPWKSELTSWRPLADQRMRHKRIVKLSEDRGYACVLHQTPVVTYFADGSVALQCYSSQSTQLFAWYMKPEGCRPVSHKGEMWWSVETDEGTHYYAQDGEPLVLEPTGKGKWRLLSRTREATERAYNAKAGAQARKLIKPYLDWFDLTSRMNGNKYYGKFAVPSQGHIQTLMDNPDGVGMFRALAESGATPDLVRKHAYEITGAYTQVAVPHDRLPRTSR